MATRQKPSQNLLRGLTAGSTYRLKSDIAVELEVYSQVGKHGTKKNIVEQALAEWFTRNPIRPKIREAAILILNERGDQ